jgi:tRNA G18 (ribose-2'-O)-methylase SpoU
LQSGSNIGSICRNALAFNVSEVIIVGRKNIKEKMYQTDRGARRMLKFKFFLTISDASNYLKTEKNCKIYGIEIMSDAKPITSFTFIGSTAFIFGNEGAGLSTKQRSVCDGFIYIPQYASSGMASINVACASAIVLQTFAVFAQYPESKIIDEKFQ